MKKRQQGSIQAFALFFLVIISVVLAALSFYVSSSAAFVHTCEKHFCEQRAAISLLDEIESELQNICKEKAHNAFSPALIHIREKFADTDIELEDVSSLINERFTAPEIAKHSDVAALTALDKKKYTSEYGWISVFYPAGETVLNAVKKDFVNLTDLFPLVNTLPQVNVHYIPEELLSAILKAFKIKNSDEKAAIIAYTAAQEGLIKQQLQNILSVPEDHRIYKFLGVQTTFWRISYRYNSYVVTAVFAGIPDKEKGNDEVEKYILIERNIRHE